MKIFKGAYLRDYFAVIVMAAGLEGMTAASWLAKRGFQVLMIDQQNQPCGCCPSFKREGVVFDTDTVMFNLRIWLKGVKQFRFIRHEKK